MARAPHKGAFTIHLKSKNNDRYKYTGVPILK